MQPKQLAAFNLGMKEFDAECERHFAILIVKVVDPGCTLELQIEECITGKVHRLTTADSDADDREAFEKVLVKAFWSAWDKLQRVL